MTNEVAVVEVVCDRNPKHKGTVMAAVWEREGGADCHDHAKIAAQNAKMRAQGMVVEDCQQDDDCGGKMVRVRKA